MENSIIQNAEADLAGVAREIAELEAALAEKKARRAKIEAFIEMSAFYARPPAASAGQLPLNLNLRGMTIADGCEAIMKASGGSAKATAMIKILRDAGKLKGQGRGDYGTVIQTLQRFPDRFEKVSPGLWRLRAGNNVAAQPASVETLDIHKTSQPGQNGLGAGEVHPVATG